MQTNESQDAWVLARFAALERANRLLWAGLVLTFMTLASLGLAAAMVATHLELPAGMASALGGGGTVSVDELQVHKAVRVVDDAGRDLVWIGREPDRANPGSDGQAVTAAGPRANPNDVVAPPRRQRGSARRSTATRLPLFAGARGTSRAAAPPRARFRSSATARALQCPPGRPRRAAPPASQRRAEAGYAPAGGTGGRWCAFIDLTNPCAAGDGKGFPVRRPRSPLERRSARAHVNATSLDQARAEFRLSVGKREVPFTVARIDAGTSAQFVVELPQSPSADGKDARMRWTRSSVSYGEE
jgi:hypothetical protein